MTQDTQKLFTKNFTLITASSFFVAWSLYIVLTIFPIFLIEELQVSGTISGIILALFPFGALLCRPLAGWVSDSFPKKRTALIAVFAFLLTGSGYFVLTSPFALAICRLLQGFTFSVASTTLSTIAIEIIPEKKLGTGVGIYSANYSLAMIVGPMAGFFVFSMFATSNTANAYQSVFLLAVFACIVSLLTLAIIQIKPKTAIKKVPFSKDNLILKSGLSSTFCLACTAILYGIILNYVALFSNSIGLGHLSSRFFMFMGIGLVISRLVSGYLYDRGYVYPLVVLSNIAVICFTTLLLNTNSTIMFFVIAFGLGFGFGGVIPTFQSLLVQFAKVHERGLASSTYFIAFDTGTMLALFAGGMIIDYFSISAAFYTGVIIQFLLLFVFIFFVMPEYKQMKMNDNNKSASNENMENE